MSCKLYLENYQNYCKPGDEIVGKVECYFRDLTRLRNIKVSLKCKEHNEWTETKTRYDEAPRRDETVHITYSGDNIIFTKQQILFGSESGEYHLSGKHTYQFRFVLPTNLPSSFEGLYGSIQYQLKAIVHKPRHLDDEDYRNFNVKAPLYVDRFPPEELRQTTFEDEKTVCCWCCKGGDISMVVLMPRMVFAIGETINFTVKLTNLSNRNVDQIQIKLDEIVTFKVTTPSHRSRTTTELIFRVREDCVDAHGEYTYNLSIPIPDYIEVPNFTNCHLFKVDYHFQVEACLSGCSTNLKIDIYPELAHIASQRFRVNAPLAPPIGFGITPSSDIATVPLATIVDVNVNQPPTPSIINEATRLISGNLHPPYYDTMK